MSRIGLNLGCRVLVVIGLLVLFVSAPNRSGGATTMGSCSLQTSVNCTS